MPQPDSMPSAWVDTAAGLDDLIASLAGAPSIAFDTEFHGERSYLPHLMLVQVATRDRIYLVDPRAELEIGALFRAMRDSGALIIGHALHNDLEIVALQYDVCLKNLFDTQIAAAFCGFGLQIGLASLLASELDVRVPKGAQLADWSRRPLPEKQALYAANDVRYLHPLYDRLAERLERSGRRAWVDEETAPLCEPGRYGRRSEDAWQRVTGGRRLQPKELGILAELAAERDRIAREVDTVPHFLISDELLLGLARHAPSDRDGLLGDRRFTHRNIARYVERWLAAVATGRQQPLHLPKGRPPPEAGVEAVAGLVMLLVNEVAAQEGVAAQMLIRRRNVVEALQDGCPSEAELWDRLGLSGWRLDLIGEPVRRLLRGQTHAQIRCASDKNLAVAFVEPTAS